MVCEFSNVNIHNDQRQQVEGLPAKIKSTLSSEDIILCGCEQKAKGRVKQPCLVGSKCEQ